MAEQLEIIWTEKAGASATPQSQPSAPDSQSPSDRTPGPSDRVVGPKKPDSQGIGRDLENAAQKIANALGIGGLTGTALELRKAFSRLYESVTAAEKAVESKRSADVGGGGPSGEIKGPPSKSGGVSSPSGEVEAPPIIRKPLNPAIPNVGAFERQAAKGEIAGPAVTRAVKGPIPNVGWFERMTAAKEGAAAPPVVGGGVPGIPVPPPVVGPAAGAGTAASGMARLAAVAGPAALAVAALTAGVVAGAVAVKKAFDVMNHEAERLSGLSGHLAASTTINAVRAEFSDIRRASRIGPQLASVNDASGQIMSKIADVNTELLKVVVDFANAFKPALPLLINTLDLVAAGIPVATDTLVAILQVFTLKIDEAIDIDERERANLNRLVGSIDRLLKNEIEDAKALAQDPFAVAFLGNFGNRPGKPPAIRAPPKPKPPAPGGGGMF